MREFGARSAARIKSRGGLVKLNNKVRNVLVVLFAFAVAVTGELFDSGGIWASITIGLATALVLTLAPAVITVAGRRLRTWIIWVFEHDKVATIARLLSLMLFIVGFHFDLLAS